MEMKTVLIYNTFLIRFDLQSSLEFIFIQIVYRNICSFTEAGRLLIILIVIIKKFINLPGRN